MRLLANENVPGEAVDLLRTRGHDVAWVREDSPGSGDDPVLRRAQGEERVLITLDKDFGELAFRSGFPASCGVILLRLTLPSPENAAEMIANVLEARQDWAGHFAVVEEGRVRMTPLPGKKTNG